MKTLFPENISNTSFTLWSQCQLRWFREQCQRLEKPAFDINLTAGTTFAKGIELARKAHYIDGKSPHDAMTIGHLYVLETLHAAEFQDELKSPERMALAVTQYFATFPFGEGEVEPIKLETGDLAIEYMFELPLPIGHPELDTPLKYKGILDLLGTWRNKVYVVDEKTCKVLSKHELLATAGQLIGYASAARKLGYAVQGILVRQVAIQKSGIKIQQIEVPVTDFMVDKWEQAMLYKIQDMVKRYLWYTQGGRSMQECFIPDYQMGCTAFFKPCQFQEGCTSKFGESFIASEFEQLTSVQLEDGSRKTMTIEERRIELGLDT